MHAPATSDVSLLGENHTSPEARPFMCSGLASAKLEGCSPHSPGMEGGDPQQYGVVLFGPTGRRTYMRFLGDKALS